ncbi:Protein root UVB sensitive 6 [Bienertia sinuspersici]
MAPLKLRQSSSSTSTQLHHHQQLKPNNFIIVIITRCSNSRLVEDDYIDSNLRLICCEEIDGRRWKYVAENDSFGKFKKGSVRSVSLQTPQAPIDELTSFIRSYVVPEGFPDSVSPSYVPYMTWRALKHFFGGAMGVFTTQTLLTSVGVSRNRATPGAVAINWILKLRFAGDLLMELGAGVELATAAMPNLFLPLACAANVAKNVAAVTSTSTRTPIYKAFAKGENIGDVTAKGECVGNVADLLGTGLSIMLSKRNPSLFTTFGFLSCGYILSSYQEVKSVVLSTLNRARFTVAVDSFLKTGSVPSLKEGNLKESVFAFPWVQDISVQLGCRFKDAFQDPGVYIALEPLFEREKYIVTYNPMKNRVCALLKDHAKSEDILKAAFHGHVLNHFIRSLVKKQTGMYYEHDNIDSIAMPPNIESLVAESCKLVSTTYSLFKYKAAEQGWVMSESLLNPGRARLCQD